MKRLRIYCMYSGLVLKEILRCQHNRRHLIYKDIENGKEIAGIKNSRFNN